MTNARRKLRKGDAIALLAAGALTVYWAWTYTGVYRWLAELQLRLTHEYEVQLTFVGSLIVACIPFFFLTAVVRRAVYGYQNPATAPHGTTQDQPTSPPHPLQIPLWTGGIFALIGIGLAIAGAYQKHRGKSAGQIVQADAANFELGHAPAAEYLSVKGFSLSDAAQSFKDSDAGTKYYVPLVSTNWRPDKPVGIFLEADASNMMPTNYYQRSQLGGNQIPEIWEGMTDLAGLPGAVRTQYEDHHLALASGYRLLYVGQTPESMTSKGHTMIYCGSAVAAVSLLVTGISIPFILWRQHNRPQIAAIPFDPRLEIISIGGQSVPPPPRPTIVNPAPIQPQPTTAKRSPSLFSIPQLIITIALLFFGFPLAAWGFLGAIFIGDAASKGQAGWTGVFIMSALALVGIAMVVSGLVLGIMQIVRVWKAIRPRA